MNKWDEIKSGDQTHIALETLSKVESKHPNIWSMADDLQKKFTGKMLREGCVFTFAEAQLLSLKLVRGGIATFHPALLGALVAWRPTKGIYRFHPELYESLIETDVKGEIPSDILLRMPGWAVFIETPFSDNMPYEISGFWAYLSRIGKQEELVLVGLWRKEGQHLEYGIDPEKDVLLYNLPLGHHPVSDLVSMMYQEEDGLASRKYKDAPDGVKALSEHVASAMLSLLLYLCSEKPDIADWEPQKPHYKYLGKKRRWIACKQSQQWDVGLRLGAALRAAREKKDSDSESGAGGASVRPHVRRAHWHSFWVGKRGEQKLSLRWLPPIPVKVNDGDDLPVVLHPVQGESEISRDSVPADPLRDCPEISMLPRGADQ